MPVSRPPPANPLDDRWMLASSDYARTVRKHGTGTAQAREAWKCAKQALDALVNSRSQEFKDEAEARAAELIG